MSKVAFGEEPDFAVGFKDAAHMPCVVVTCAKFVLPGDHVKFTDGGTQVEECHKGDRHGIVDPFLTEAVPPGKSFYILLLPKVVGSLTHNFPLIIDNNPTNEPECPDADENDGDGEMSECQAMGCD